MELYFGEAHNWELDENVVQVLVYGSEQERDVGESQRKKNYQSVQSYEDFPNDVVYNPILKIRAVRVDSKLFAPIIREGCGNLVKELNTKFLNATDCIQYAKQYVMSLYE